MQVGIIAGMAIIETYNWRCTLKAWREQHNVTQEEVAALTNLSQAFVSRLESGTRNLSPLDRVKFAQALGASVRDIFMPIKP
jgi:transcriptional regulator with XRE-family HTH domain